MLIINHEYICSQYTKSNLDRKSNARTPKWGQILMKNDIRKTIFSALDKHLSVERIFPKNQTEYKMILFLF